MKEESKLELDALVFTAVDGIYGMAGFPAALLETAYIIAYRPDSFQQILASDSELKIDENWLSISEQIDNHVKPAQNKCMQYNRDCPTKTLIDRL